MAATLAAAYVGASPAVAGVLGGLLVWGASEGADSLVTWALDALLRSINADPLVLDLDGDGIELSPLGSSTMLFDMDADGVTERTGWVSPHDGLLVHDANGNGAVDGVGELFGSANVDGYDELETIDGNGDGRIDSLDPAFADLRVWRDLNSDGVSTADEMLTLAQAGIARLNLGYTQIDTDVQGNIVAREGSYVRADGTTRDMASVWFELDESVNRPSIPDGAELGNLLVLPNLPASGPCADLRTAMFFDPSLKAMVEDLVFGDHDFDTFQEFADEGFIDMLYRWTGVDTTVPEDPEAPYYLQVFEALTGLPLEVTNDHQRERLEELWPNLVKQLGVQFLFQAAQSPALVPFHELAQDLAALDPESPTFSDGLAALTEAAVADANAATPAYEYLEFFTGLTFDRATGAISGDFDAFVARFIEDQPSFFFLLPAGGVGGGGGAAISMTPPSDDEEPLHPWAAWYEDQGALLFYIADAMGIGAEYVLNVTGWRWIDGVMGHVHGTAGADLLDETLTQLESPVFGPNGWITETRDHMFVGYEGDDELRGNDGVDRLIGGTGNDLLKGGSGSDMYIYAIGDGLDRIIEQSGEDTIYFSSELNSADLHVARVTGTNDLLLHFGDPASGITLTNQWSSASAAVEQFHFVAEDGLDAGDIASLYLATLATAGADTIAGSWAGERLIGLDGNDALSGADGEDVLEGGAGDDVLKGNDHNDLIDAGSGNDTADGGSGDDTLIGGPGNDILTGWSGNDIYVFNLGDGQDIIRDYSSIYSGGVDTVVLGAGILLSDVVVTQLNNGTDLLLSILGTADSVLLDNSINSGDYRIESVQFADGTFLSHAELMILATAPTSGNDVFYGSYDPEVLQGGGGNDTLDARGDDDTLIGGTGNDILTGWSGADTYVFNLGDGHDIIRDYWGTGSGGVDTVVLGAGILLSDLAVTQTNNGTDLLLSIAGAADSILLDNSINSGDYRIEGVQFADGTVVSHAELMILATAPTSGNDVFYGSYDPETLRGGAGNDTLDARGGSDILVGGTGNDILTGWSGNDSYVFNLGDGQDTIRDYSGTGSGGVDTIVLGTGIVAGDVAVSQLNNGTDLLVSIIGTTDSVLLDNSINSGDYRIEKVQFADGSVLSHAELMVLATVPTSGDDVFYGSYDGEALQGGDGNDTLYARDGDDTLIGGVGDDRLEGGSHVDTYIYNFGDGNDVIYDVSYDSSPEETLLFGEGIAAGDLIFALSATDADDVVISFTGFDGSVVLDEQTRNSGVELIRFADGSTLTEVEFMALVGSGSAVPAMENAAVFEAFRSEGGAGLYREALMPTGGEVRPLMPEMVLA